VSQGWAGVEGVLDAPLDEQPLHDLGHGSVLEDSMVPPVAEEPWSGGDGELVRREAGGLGVDLLDEGANAGPPAPPAVKGVRHAGGDGERRARAGERVEVDAVMAGDGHHRDIEEARHRLIDCEMADGERVIPGGEPEIDL